MSNPAPIDGKCNAKCRDGGFCGQDPIGGTKRCRMHGGAGSGHQGTHGLSSKFRLRYCEPHLQERLDELMADPELIDVRRAVAASQAALEEMPLQPNRDTAERMVRRALQLEPKDDVPETAVENMMHELRAVYAERFVASSGQHARTAALAAKQEKVAELLLRGALPIMRRFAERVAGLVRSYIPPAKQAEFLGKLKEIMGDVQLEILKLGEEADTGARG